MSIKASMLCGFFECATRLGTSSRRDSEEKGKDLEYLLRRKCDPSPIHECISYLSTVVAGPLDREKSTAKSDSNVSK